jgi:hypothetical protein
MRPSTADGWYVLSIIVVSFRKFRGKKPAARRPVNAYNRMGGQRSPVMILTHPPSWPDLFQPFTSFVIEEASKTWMPTAQARSRASSGALGAGMMESFDRDVFLPDAARRSTKGTRHSRTCSGHPRLCPTKKKDVDE